MTGNSGEEGKLEMLTVKVWLMKFHLERETLGYWARGYPC
jgi:hypothetical protein